MSVVTNLVDDDVLLLGVVIAGFELLDCETAATELETSKKSDCILHSSEQFVNI